MLVRLLWLTAFLALPGCNALYYYDTQKAAINVEGRPDPSQPFHVNIGMKQRQVVVAPPMRKDRPDAGGATMHCGDDNVVEQCGGGDAVSMIGSFRANKKALFGRTIFETSFLTGDAAKRLTREEAQNVARVLAGAQPIPTPQELGEEARKKLIDRSKCEELRTTLFAKTFDQLTDAEKQTLGNETSVGESNYSKAIHDALRQAVEAKGCR